MINVSLASCINAAAPVNQDALGAAVRYAGGQGLSVIAAAAGNQGGGDQGTDCGQNPAFNTLDPNDPRTGLGCAIVTWRGSPTTCSPSAR